jgi:uncharacterized protein
MMSALRLILIIAAVGYLVIVASMYFAQRKLQYFPDKKGLTPESVGLVGVEVAKLKTEDGETVIVWYSPGAPERPTIMFFHGNAGEIGDRAARFAAYQAQGASVLFLSYRGYGGSTGAPSERGLVLDALTAYDWVRSRGVSAAGITLVGESLGTGVAVQLAARRRVAALVLEAPFASAADVAAKLYWWLPVGLLMKDKFESSSLIGDIGAPLLIIHGERDEIIPLAEGKKLYARANEPKEMVVIKGGSHASISGEETWAREIAFFERALANQAGSNEKQNPAGLLPRG